MKPHLKGKEGTLNYLFRKYAKAHRTVLKNAGIKVTPKTLRNG